MPKYTEADVRKALDEIKRGIPIATAAIKYGIPRTTLSGKHHNVYPIEIRKGPVTILTAEEEKHLENWMFHLSDAGFAITPDQLLDSVQRLVKELKRQTPFTDGRPGRKWYQSFMRRHPDVAKKLSRNLSHPRTMVTQENVRNWFKEVADYLTAENLMDVLNDPNRVFNTDETAFFLCPKGDHVLVRKSSKMVYNFVNNDDKECITALIGGNAAGLLMPPMVVYTYQRVPGVVSELFPKTWAIGRSENGWMTSETFYEYIANFFHPWLIQQNIKLPVILFVDGHSSHGTLHLSEFCRKNQIVLVALYPNSTHFLQPMDVSCFHPLKGGWKKGVRKWRFDNGGIKLRRENFAPLLEEVIGNTIRPQTMINGFRKCGLHPFTPEAINFKDMMVKSSATEPSISAQTEVQNKDDIDHQLFIKWIEETLPTDLLHGFQTAGDDWTGNIEHKSLFGFWRKESDLAVRQKSTAAGAIRSSKACDSNLQVVPYTRHPENPTSADGQTLIFDYCSLPTVDFGVIECLPSEDIQVIEVSQDVQSTLQVNESLAGDYNELFMQIPELPDGADIFNYMSDSNCSRSDYESDDSDSSFDGDSGECIVSAGECKVSSNLVTEKDVIDVNPIGSNGTTPSRSLTVQDVNVIQETAAEFSLPSHIPSGTPAAFAKVLFYPGERHLKGKKKRSDKKQKVPAVYSSAQYSEYLREKERKKEEIQNAKNQRKLEREVSKKRKEDEKKERELERTAKKEAVAIRNAELAAKKANVAKKKAEEAAKKAEEAAKKASSREVNPSDVAQYEGSLALKQKKRKIEVNIKK